MNKELNCIMLIDDSPDDNFYHERVIKKANVKNVVIIEQSASDALVYLNSKKIPKIDLIFLDINMPGMNGWEFLEEYNQLAEDLKGSAVIIMLTTSDNVDDVARSSKWTMVSEFITKPLTKETVQAIAQRYFQQ